MKKRKIIFPKKGYIWIVIIFSIQFSARAEICPDLAGNFSFSKRSAIKSDYFDEYYIEKRTDIYIIYATKVAELSFNRLVEVLNDFEKFADFMPGYQSIKIKQTSENQFLTEIDFRPAFSPFSSHFTNEVEISSGNTVYRQCWQQLDQTDTRIIKPFKNAPVHNKGYWEILALDGRQVRITYFSIIQPPVNIPAWLYRLIVKNGYTDAFKAIVQQSK